MTFVEWYVRRGRLSLPALGRQYVLPLLALGLVAGITDSFRGDPPPASEGWSIWTYTGGPVSLTLLLVTLVPWVSATVAGAAGVIPGLSGDDVVAAEDVHDGDVSVLA